ncbi:MAG: response regulator transcription factor [Alphaproteobacteria bacterium]
MTPAQHGKTRQPHGPSGTALAADHPTGGPLPPRSDGARAVAAQKRILLVDDDVELVEMVREYLEPEGFAVAIAHDGAACLASDPEQKDLIVLDVMLPGLSGFEVLKELRRRSAVPVILLTARDSDMDRVVGLEIGADDYVPKPFNPRELVARIRAVLRRTQAGVPQAAADLAVGDVHLNASARSVQCGGRILDLTTAEFNLLEHLLRKAGQIVTRDELSAAAFGRQQMTRIDRNVDTLVSKVRRKLDADGDLEEHIKTVRNIGYLFALPAAPSREA